MTTLKFYACVFLIVLSTLTIVAGFAFAIYTILPPWWKP